jgi:hypothetical protein
LKEWLKCRLSPEYFIRNYIYLQDRAQTKTLKFEPWPHLIDLIYKFLDQRLIIILKARQIGISWLVAAYSLWKAKFYENAKILMLSQGEDEAFELLDKCKFIDNSLPSFLKEERVPDQRGHIGFPSTNSKIKALPSTEKAGRSTDATIIVTDEWEFHPYAQENFAALRPTISGGGQAQWIGLSTADTTKVGTFFKQTYISAKTGKSRFFNIFLPWNIRPGRDDKWFEEETWDMPAHQRQGEYPATEEEALSVVKTRRFFDRDAIAQMKAEANKPLDHELSRKYGTVRVYKLPVVGTKYVIFTDPSDGKEDAHATWVMNAKTEEQVAESHGLTTADLNAQIHDELVRYYNNAFNGYELNARAGGIFSHKIKELGTPNQAGYLKPDWTLDKEKKGWWTTKKIWGKVIWNGEEWVRLRKGVIHSLDALDEFSLFIVPEGEDPQKPKGGSDDYIDAFIRCVYLKMFMPLGEIRVTSMKYRE